MHGLIFLAPQGLIFLLVPVHQLVMPLADVLALSDNVISATPLWPAQLHLGMPV